MARKTKKPKLRKAKKKRIIKPKKAKNKIFKKPKKKNRRIIKIVRKNIKEISLREEAEVKKTGDDSIHKTKIRVIGIGGGAGTIVSEIASVLKKVDFVVANTDTKSLNELAKKVKRFQFGQNLTKGLGTGMNEQIGELAALQDKEKIEKLMEGQDLCIMVACLGGGTSSGAAPLFAKTAKKMGSLSYGIFTLPFEFEGENKMDMALRALEKIKPYLNAYSVIPNERIFQIIDKNTPLKSALSAINKRLADNLEGLIEMIYYSGIINIDFADFKTILVGKGRLVYLNHTEINGLGKEEAVKNVISSSLYQYNIKGARGILYNIEGGEDLKLLEVAYISKTILDLVNKQAKIIFGISKNNKLHNKIRVTLLAAGCAGKFLPGGIGQKKKAKALKNNLKNKPDRKKILGRTKKVESKKTQSKKSIRFPKSVSINRRTPKRTADKKTSKTGKTKKPTLTPKKETAVFGARQTAAIKTSVPQELNVKVRRNGLELKRVVEEAENEIIEQEKMWETPAILRKDNTNN